MWIPQVAGPCRQAMWQASDNFGCCWETSEPPLPTGYLARRVAVEGGAASVTDGSSCGSLVV
jgi:hypothetical protein